eukprot:TRINITY_DN7925_c0_g1_i1.p1 TRINITY_DN7925_c0_g1~~TRINITY_DN7925_c0_g1_i1.p1  ORF type:complete len:128 (+),score=16.01 TRINITY_DN7925_c0_g1_i1:48-431(+)
MVKDARVTFRRRHCYNTPTNKFTIKRTPGNVLKVQYLSKRVGRPMCAEKGCDLRLQGVGAHRAVELSRIPKKNRTVARAYGGNLCAPCVRQRVLRAFLVEESKIVKRYAKEKEQQEKKPRKGKKKAH